jgi:hypothetical protein
MGMRGPGARGGLKVKEALPDMPVSSPGWTKSWAAPSG